VVAHDLAAHHAMKVPLQRGDARRQVFQFGKRYDTDLTIFQGNRIARVRVPTDAIHAKNFPMHLKTGDMITPILGDYVCLEKSCFDRINRAEGIPIAIQMLTAFKFLAITDHIVQLLQLCVRQSQRQAKFAGIALRAGVLQTVQLYCRQHLQGNGFHRQLSKLISARLT
jgi:hypothetical protein